MLPPKIGDGVFGSSSGGVKPTGASFVGASVFSSAAAALTVLWAMDKVRGLGLVNKKDEVGFHGIRGSLLVLGVVILGVKRPAWVAMEIVDSRVSRGKTFLSELCLSIKKGSSCDDYREKSLCEWITGISDFRRVVVFCVWIFG